jgi:hypothetical protein
VSCRSFRLYLHRGAEVPSGAGRRVFLRHLGMNTTWYLHSHFAWLRLSESSIVKPPFGCVAAHESGVSSMDDCRNCLLLPPRQSRGTSLGG